MALNPSAQTSSVDLQQWNTLLERKGLIDALTRAVSADVRQPAGCMWMSVTQTRISLTHTLVSRIYAYGGAVIRFL